MPCKRSQDARRQLLSEYNVSHDHTSRKAPGHELHFGNVLELSRRTVQQYTHDVCTDFHEKPWRQHNKNRAEAISERVKRCLEQRRNEPGWRLHVEDWVFRRFEVEVICPECRAHLWRSELEAETPDSPQSSDLLQKRRSARKPCQCQRHRNGVERYDDGLNDLFESREEDGIVHEEEIMCRLGKTKEKPDRVWGLRTTKRIERILSRQQSVGVGTVGDTMTMSPFTGDASTLLYPFLLLEAKSEKSADNFSDIDIQTGFTIRTLLNLQHNLVESLPVHQKASIQSATLPLVWMVASKGDQWRVSGAYTNMGTSGLEYHILDLWEGRLTHTDEALRLVLILDYIFDWARDIYRGAIVDGLSSLVQSPSNSLRSDTDVISTREFQKDLIDFRHSAPEAETAGVRGFESSDMLRFYDKSGLALRDSSFMSHRVVGLHLTVETLDNFLCSVSRNDEEKSSLAESLFCTLRTSKCWSVTADCLNKLERAWTGFDRESVTFESFQQPFLAFFSVKSHFGTGAVKFTSKTKYDDWVQVHTLNFIAIAADALDDLRKMLGYSGSVHLLDVSEFSTEAVISVFEEIRHAPVRQCLAATIETRQVISSYTIVDKEVETSEHNNRAGNTPPRWPTLRQTPLTDDNAGAELPERVYRRLKTGMREPDEDFLRVSTFEGEHKHENSGCTFWPGGQLKIGSRQLAVHVSWPQIRRRVGALDRVAHCIFLLPPPTNQRIAIKSEPYDSTTSTHVLTLKADAGLFSNQPCIERLCVNAHVKALQILYQVTGCYFEHVHKHQKSAWQNFFREWKLGESIPCLDFPPEEDQEYCLDTLRRAGVQLGLESKLMILIETFGNALRSHYSSSQPKSRSELMTSSGLKICVCSPLDHWSSSSISSLPDRARVLSSTLSNGGGSLEPSGLNYQFHTVDLGLLATSEITESGMDDAALDEDDSTYQEASSDSEESMNSLEDELMSEDYEETLQSDDIMDSDDSESSSELEGSIGTVSSMRLFVTGLNTQAAIGPLPGDSIVFRMSLPSMGSAIMARDPANLHYQLGPVIQDAMYTHMLSVPQVRPPSTTSLNQTSFLPPGMPSRRIGINDILNN